MHYCSNTDFFPSKNNFVFHLCLFWVKIYIESKLVVDGLTTSLYLVCMHAKSCKLPHASSHFTFFLSRNELIRSKNGVGDFYLQFWRRKKNLPWKSKSFQIKTHVRLRRSLFTYVHMYA